MGVQHSSFFILQYVSVKCQHDWTITVASYVRKYFDVFSASSDRCVWVTWIKDRPNTFNLLQVARQPTDDILIYEEIYQLIIVRQCRRNLVLHVLR